FVVASVARLRDPSADEAWFRGYRDSYDQSACTAAGGVAGHAESVINGRTVFIGTCAAGAITYHVRLAGGSIVLSLTSVGPDRLVVYGGTGRAARSWGAFDAIVRELRAHADDETLVVQSGKPIAVFRTHEWAPRVLIANSNLVGKWATCDVFRDLERRGLMMY